MSVLIDREKRVIVQGITGREGQARTRLMLDYGTRVVGGVTPGKGGTEVLGLPVFSSCAEAVAGLRGRDEEKKRRSSGVQGRGANTVAGECPVDVSVLFVPALAMKEAALDAIAAGIKLLVLVADRVPVWDAMEIAAAAEEHGASFLGPNTLGVAAPGEAVLGMIGGRAESAREWFKPPLPGKGGTGGGSGGGTGVGIVSRSGGMSSSTAYYLGQAGVRISGIVHVGGDAVLGLRIPHVARLYQADPRTDAIVVFGEIGGSQEEELAEMARRGEISKPIVAYIGGKAATSGTRFSHAGAIIEGNRGTHAGKVKALREAGAVVVESFGELPGAVVERLRTSGRDGGPSTSLMTEAEKRAVWTTAVTRIRPNSVAVRGHDIAGLMGKVSFGAAVYLILTGELPNERIGRLMDAILVSSIDHGATPPSALAARTVASTGATLSASVAAGIMSINRHHGGAIEDAARFLGALVERAAREGKTLDDLAVEDVSRIKATGARVSGFGHRIHTKDPRTARLFALAAEAGLRDDGLTHVAAARAVERAFAALGKPLPINVDGALGAILADLGLDPKVFNGIFMAARVPGLVAHVVEEQTRERPMRRIDPVNHAYDGPSGE
ncbi:MAG: citryl-CoA lyase [Phycisphaerales bacterium]